MNPELFCKHCPFVSTTETPPGDYATPSLTCSHVNQSPRPVGDCLSVVRTTCVPRMSLLGLPRDIFWSRFVRRTHSRTKVLNQGGRSSQIGSHPHHESGPNIATVSHGRVWVIDGISPNALLHWSSLTRPIRLVPPGAQCTVFAVSGLALMDVSMAPNLKRQVGSFKGSKWDWECM